MIETKHRKNIDHQSRKGPEKVMKLIMMIRKMITVTAAS